MAPTAGFTEAESIIRHFVYSECKLRCLNDLTALQLNEVYDRLAYDGDETTNKRMLLAWMIENFPDLRHPRDTVPLAALVTASMELRKLKTPRGAVADDVHRYYESEYGSSRRPEHAQQRADWHPHDHIAARSQRPSYEYRVLDSAEPSTGPSSSLISSARCNENSSTSKDNTGTSPISSKLRSPFMPSASASGGHGEHPLRLHNQTRIHGTSGLQMPSAVRFSTGQVTAKCQQTPRSSNKINTTPDDGQVSSVDNSLHADSHSTGFHLGIPPARNEPPLRHESFLSPDAQSGMAMPALPNSYNAAGTHTDDEPTASSAFNTLASSLHEQAQPQTNNDIVAPMYAPQLQEGFTTGVLNNILQGEHDLALVELAKIGAVIVSMKGMMDLSEQHKD